MNRWSMMTQFLALGVVFTDSAAVLRKSTWLSRNALRLCVAGLLGFLGFYWAEQIGPPAVADVTDEVIFVVMGFFAGYLLCRLLEMLWRLRRDRAAWREQFVLPLLVKEARAAFRGHRLARLVYISAGLAVFVDVVLLLASTTMDVHEVSDFSRFGRLFFAVHLVVQGILTVLLTPGLTGGAIAREREMQTLEPLLLTRMTDTQIAWSKLISGLMRLALCLLCMLPAVAVGMAFGGIAPLDLLAAYAQLLAAAVCLGALGLWCSTWTRRGALGIGWSYLLAAVLIFGTPLLTITDGLGLAPSYYWNWTEYIEYLDPLLAYGIVAAPDGQAMYGFDDYGGIVAEFEEDWPIILSMLLVYLGVASWAMGHTVRAIGRLRRERAPRRRKVTI